MILRLISGLSLRGWLIAGAFVAAGGLVLGAYAKGRSDASAACEARRLAGELAQARLDLEIAQRAAEDAARLTAAADAAKAKADEEAARYAEALKTRPDPGCVLTPADVGYLLRIAPGSR